MLTLRGGSVPNLCDLVAGLATWIMAVVVSAAIAVHAAEPESQSLADGPVGYRPETELDISGPYHAWIDGEQFPATLDVWGPMATLKIAMDGQDKPMEGMFLNNLLKVVARYGLENFSLTTMVEAQCDGWAFQGQYRRLDEKLGAKVAGIVLAPVWRGGGGGGDPVKMPLPRRPDDVSGNYGLTLEKDGQTISTDAVMKVTEGTVKMWAGGREYLCDFSDQEMFPLFWEGRRMDTFRLKPTETGFEGSLTKEVNGRQEVVEVQCAKGRGGGGGGDDRPWTYVYDAILNNSPPVYIAKLTLHDDEARLVIDINKIKATMIGSLADGVLSGTGDYGRAPVSIRALKAPGGFVGVFRNGSGAAVREFPIVLKNRPGRAVAPQW